MTAVDTSWIAVPRRRRNGWKGLRAFVIRWGALVALGVVWEVAARLIGSPFFPPISKVIGRFVDLWFSGPPSALFLTERFGTDLLPSLGRLFGGWGLGVALGILLGVAIGRSRTFGDYVEPIMHFARAIPPPALLPIFFILLGIGDGMKISLIAFAVVWPVLLNTIDGVRSVEPLHLDTSRVFAFPRGKIFFGIVLPSASPKIFAGLRVSLAVALIVMVIAEMSSTSGIGYNVVIAQRSFQMLDMWAGILVLGIIGYVLTAILSLVETRVTRWHQGSREGVQ
ncbi:ABC transporter permease [Leucobacter allii]|uniref:ABC transporter permease n=1 Tax=Leucobacter allii TaxID=2932247 RepID=A0ABY4FMD7_9MICO|nr:ABC transporter permease [Leucobacter allii]UOQ57375.1 ABC transporter permease [Leucobacter allii]UOR01823.1 ABC transporter permease [Leucobacter allii]